MMKDDLLFAAIAWLVKIYLLFHIKRFKHYNYDVLTLLGIYP